MEKIFDNDTEKQIKEKFIQEMKNQVDLILFTNNIIIPGKEEIQEINEFTKKLLKELNRIEPRIILKELSILDEKAKELGITTSPSIAIGYESGYKIIFNGAPLGHEGTSLIELITLISSGDSHLEENSKKLLKYIEKEVHLQVFVTPTCSYCPMAVIRAGQIAIELKGKVKAEFIEASENPQLATKFNVSSVPHTVINGILESGIVGAVPETNLIRQILQYSGNEEYKIKLKEEENMKKEKEKLSDKPEGVIFLTDNNINDAIKKYDNLVIDFWAEWCGPCKMIAPAIEQLAKEKAGQIVFGKLNVDENPEASSEYEIMAIPTLLVFKKGEKAGTIQGALPKKELENKINELLAGVK